MTTTIGVALSDQEGFFDLWSTQVAPRLDLL
jgi:hypothetical protein